MLSEKYLLYGTFQFVEITQSFKAHNALALDEKINVDLLQTIDMLKSFSDNYF